MATIELNINEQTLARARRVAESRATSVEAICTDVLERIGTDPETGFPPMSTPTSIIGSMADQADLLDQIVALAMADRERESHGSSR